LRRARRAGKTWRTSRSRSSPKSRKVLERKRRMERVVIGLSAFPLKSIRIRSRARSSGRPLKQTAS
jgi:hypothetical protein